MTSDRPRTATRWFLVLAATFVTASAYAQSSPQDEARRHYRAGVEAARTGNCTAAIGEFRESLALVDSPNTRLLYARCLSETGDQVAALAEYARTEHDAAARTAQEARFAPTRDTAHEEVARIGALVGRVRITFSNDARPSSVRIAGHDVAISDALEGVVVAPGTIAIESTWNGNVQRAEATVGAGAHIDVALVAPAASAPVVTAPVIVDPHADIPPRAPSGPVWLPYVIGGLGVAGLITAGALYGAAWGEYGSAMNRCHAACADTQLATGRGLETGAYVSLGVGAALVVGGVVTWIIVRRAPASVRARFAPSSDGFAIRF